MLLPHVSSVHEGRWVDIELLYFDQDDPRFNERGETVRLDLPLTHGTPRVTIRMPNDVDGEALVDVFHRETIDDWPMTAVYRLWKRIRR